MSKYHAIGHNKDPEGRVQTPEMMRAFIGKGIFDEENGRFHHTVESDADVIILTLDGKAYGHFEIAGMSPITNDDRRSFKKVAYVYLVTRSVLYTNPVKIEEVGRHMGHEGVTLEEENFEKLLAKAGKVTIKDTPSIETRFCKIAYNIHGWKKASGVSPEKGTYVADNMFGHEEWLFRDWLINGKKYGFVEPVHKHHNFWKGKHLRLRLFTKTGEGAFCIGHIKKVYVPHDEELAEAVATMDANGWIETMRTEINAIGGDASKVSTDDPALLINIRFDPADVELEEVMIRIAPGSKPLSTNHYVLIKDDGSPFLDESVDPPHVKLSLDQRKELQFYRAAQQGTVVDPVHAQMQNRMYEWLCREYGDEAVEFESDWVDLRLNRPGETTFYELKTNASAKKCIRQAIGQLFEYAMYPRERKADRMVIVGQAMPTNDDRAYLAHLRSSFGLPVHYEQCDRITGALRSFAENGR